MSAAEFGSASINDSVTIGFRIALVVFVLVMCISVLSDFRGVYSSEGSDFCRDRSNEPLAWNCGLKADL